MGDPRAALRRQAGSGQGGCGNRVAQPVKYRGAAGCERADAAIAQQIGLVAVLRVAAGKQAGAGVVAGVERVGIRGLRGEDEDVVRRIGGQIGD